MRIIILDDQGGEKLRTNVTSIVVTSDNLFQVINEDDIISDISDTIDEAIVSLVSKL